MKDSLQKVLQEFERQHSDTREHLFQVSLAAFNGKRAVLRGRVLAAADLAALQQTLAADFPTLEVDLSAVKVLRRPEAQNFSVNTNLTSLHREPSWLAEQLTQMLYGFQVEILEERGSWVFVRCTDGYLGWTYRPYLTGDALPPATHLVIAPLSQMGSEPAENAPLVTRVMGGTFVHLLESQGQWARVQANQIGWLRVEDLRDLHNMPQTTPQRRAQMVTDAFRMVGVPYLWGGSSANGIDCSGFARLVHRWSGLMLRRDADMQMADGWPVETEHLQPGDLVFFGEEGERRAITHVGISLGGWEIIHSSRSRNGVYTDNIQQVEHLRQSFAGAVTYLEE